MWQPPRGGAALTRPRCARSTIPGQERRGATASPPGRGSIDADREDTAAGRSFTSRRIWSIAARMIVCQSELGIAGGTSSPPHALATAPVALECLHSHPSAKHGRRGPAPASGPWRPLELRPGAPPAGGDRLRNLGLTIDDVGEGATVGRSSACWTWDSPHGIGPGFHGIPR